METQLENGYEILERITDGFFAVDQQWNFTYVNTEAARLLFRNRDDLIGKNVWDEFPEAIRLPFFEHYHKAVNEQVPVTFDAFFDPLQTWFGVRAYPSPNGLTVYFRDITEEKMKSTEKDQHYQSLFHENPDAVYSFDLLGNYLNINKATKELLGYSEEELLGQSYKIVISEEDMEKTVHHFNLAVSGLPQRYKIHTIHKDGSIILLDVTNLPIIVHGEVVGVYGIGKDITAQKQAEEELQTTSQQLQSFIENNADPIFIYNMDNEVVQVNKAFEETFGWLKQEIVGKGLYSLPLIPANKWNEVCELDAIVKQGKHVIDKETVRLRKDGTRLDVMLSISPIIDAKGNMNGWSTTVRDVTEWKKSQEMLQNTEKLSIAGQLAAGIAHEIRNPITAIKGFLQLMSSAHDEYKDYFNIISSEIERIEQILSELLILAKPQVSKFERKDIKVLLAQVITLLDTQAILNNVEIVAEYQPGVTYIECDENQLKQVFINFIKNSIEAMPNGGRLVVKISKVNSEQIKIQFIDGGVGMSKETLAKLGSPFYTTKENGTGLGFMISRKIIENHFGEICITSEQNNGTTIDIILPIRI
ncbi:PAS domain-containing sensor histidine kinase [Bacillus rubiinfantis]|uniref:PAS domain-containing sensor histidine kinase n=1 Tax=Bacillus rubiinfantis TaxID=1499680 RepID=UPI0005AA58CA|nr:PAS domain-containing sensor histidine kinase [Bacillus rubiinfantis]